MDGNYLDALGRLMAERQIQFMQKSLQQQSPYKRRGDNPLSSNQANRSGQLSNYTEIMISTNNREVPFISIYKPDTGKEQRRVQAATQLHRCIKQYQQGRMIHCFGKIVQLKHHQKTFLSNCMLLSHAMRKLSKRNVESAFYRILGYRMKMKAVLLAVKTMNRFQTNFKLYNSKQAFHMLRQKAYQTIINELNDSNQLAKQIADLQLQLNFARSIAFSENFITKSKQFQRIIGRYIENLRKNDYQNILRSQIKRFEDMRSKMTPKRRELFENEQIAIIIGNIIKAFESTIVEKDSRQQQLQDKISKLEQITMQNAENHKIQITFIINQGQQSLPIRFFQAIKKTLETAQFPSHIISQILQWQQSFLQIIHRNEEMQQKLSSQTLIEQITMISSQLKQENENLKAFEKNYYELVSKNLEKDAKIAQLTYAHHEKLKEITRLQQKVQQLNLKQLNNTQKLSLQTSKVNHEPTLVISPSQLNQLTNKESSRYRLLANTSSMKPMELMKQILTLKMSLETQVMTYDSKVRQLRNQIFGYQTAINQLKAELLQKDHQYSKQKEINQQLKNKIYEQRRSDPKKNHIIAQPQKNQSLIIEVGQLKQEKQAMIKAINEAKSVNQGLVIQINQLKRQSYKKQKLLQQKISQKDSLLSKLQAKINQFPMSSHCQNLPQKLYIKQSQILVRDQQIRLLTIKVKSLQALLSDITSQYHQLQLELQHVNGQNPSPSITTLCEQKNNESKVAVKGFPDEDGFFNDKILSQKLKQLMASSESLAYSIDYNKQDSQQISLQKRHDISDKQCILHFIFAVLLEIRKIGPNSHQGAKLWKDLCHLRTTYTKKTFFVNLQIYSKNFISAPIKS